MAVPMGFEVTENPHASDGTDTESDDNIESLEFEGGSTRTSQQKACIRNSQRNAKIRMKEFPELTSQHIDKSFRGTGANYAQIEHLGMLLHLPKDKIVSIKTANNHSYNGPSMFAVDIIEAWLKDDPQRIGPNIQAQYVELEEKLREAHLNCVAGRIRKKNPEDGSTISQRLSELVNKTTKSCSNEDARTFGLKLGLSLSDIDDVIRENNIVRGPHVALALFKEAERRHTYITHSFISVVTETLKSIALENSESDKCQSVINHANSIKEDSLVLHKRIQSDFSKDQHNTVQLSKKVEVHNKWGHKLQILKVSAGVIAVFLLCILLILVSLNVPDINGLPNQAITANTTVDYHLSIDSFWLRSLDLELLGEPPCIGNAMSVNCEEILKKRPVYEERPILSNYLYLPKGTNAIFKKKSNISHAEFQCSPHYIWIFTSRSEADQNALDNFESLACSKPPEGTFCLKLNNTSNATALLSPKSSYYFIRCDGDPECNFLSSVTVQTSNLTSFTQTQAKSIDSVSVASGGGRVSLKLKDSTFRVPPADSVCVLFRLENCGSSVYHVDVTGVRSLELFFYTIVFCIFIILCGCLLTIGCFCHKRNRLCTTPFSTCISRAH